MQIPSSKPSTPILKTTFLVGLLVCLAPEASQAWEESDARMGFEYQLNRVPPAHPWKPLFQKTYPGWGLWISNQIWNPISLEVGYDWTLASNKNYVLQPNSSLFGISNSLSSPIIVTGNARFKALRTDLNLHLPLKEYGCSFFALDPELIVSGGLAFQKFLPSLTDNPSFPPLNTQVAITPRTRYYTRFGIGLNLSVTEQWGIRTTARWEDTAKIRAGGAAASSEPQIFDPKYAFTAGLFWKL